MHLCALNNETYFRKMTLRFVSPSSDVILMLNIYVYIFYDIIHATWMLEVKPSSDLMAEYEKIVPFSFLVNM